MKNNMRITTLGFIIPILFLRPTCVRAQAGKAVYPAMAPLDQYLIPDEKAEIALARTRRSAVDFGFSRSDGAPAGWLCNGCEWLERIRVRR